MSASDDTPSAQAKLKVVGTPSKEQILVTEGLNSVLKEGSFKVGHITQREQYGKDITFVLYSDNGKGWGPDSWTGTTINAPLMTAEQFVQDLKDKGTCFEFIKQRVDKGCLKEQGSTE